MSGVRQKGPERPSMQSTATASNATEQQSSPAPIYKQPLWEGKWPKIFVLITSIVIGVMFILAFSFCLAGGIKYRQPRYFLLLINLILSTGVTGLLIFWYYRRILTASLLWYVFLQCAFLFFQCVTTDFFAWYEVPNETVHTTPSPTTKWYDLTNATNGSNHSNGSNHTLW